MKSASILCVAVLLSMRLTGAVLAQAPALDIKMGLWEITTTAQIRGQMAIDTRDMTPELKDAMEKAMKKVASETYSSVAKKCVSKEWLAQWIFMGEPPAGHTCTQTPTKNTRASLDVTITCTGEHASTSQVHFDALSPSSIKGAMKITGTEQARTTTTSVALTGKWLRTDCGSEK
jgi:hypothetical protein